MTIVNDVETLVTDMLDKHKKDIAFFKKQLINLENEIYYSQVEIEQCEKILRLIRGEND